MKRSIKLLTAALLAVFVFLQIPTPAKAEESANIPSFMMVNEAVDSLRQAMVNRESPITLTFHSAVPESEEMAQSLFFSALTHTGTPNEGDYLYRHIKGVDYHSESEETDGGYISTVTYTVTYRTTAQQEKTVDAKAAEILEKLNVYDQTDYEKISAIYGYLCDNVSIDLFASPNSYTAYGALVGEIAVCQGFANAFYRLALELDVDCRLLSGALGSVKHGWNIVAIDGLYYHVDATKDAGFRPEEYRYFLKCSLTDRTVDSAYTTSEFAAAYPMGPKDYDPHVHVWDDGTITKPATCVETGVLTYACTGEDCEETYTEDIPVIDQHTWDNGVVTKAATCGETGVMLYTCTVHLCGKTYTEDIPKLTEHNWDEGVITQKPNGYREGILSFSCSVCGGTREESLPREGWQAIDGKWVYHETGVLATGWRSIGGNWYYFTSNGIMKTGWLQLGNTWYYLKADGAMKTGWLQLGNTWYYLKADGAMKTGWLQLGNTWYYLKADGAMKTGWLQLGNTWYYLKADGAMKTGWLQLGSVWYYFHSSGAMATGSVRIGVATYRFRPDGSWIN